ncbi:MAG: hypothetical protein BWX84_03019 [Verrucomicrobia bacterium ADurb.Bin118]|nr:MAG: hypothetical protein BWX84_03019 [Verrucomicrobia bacterium ADurb.Bin118]
MRVEAEHFFAQIVIETAHHTDDDDQHGHAQHDPEDGDERDDRDKRPLWPQVTQGQQQFKGQSRHPREARGQGGACQRGRVLASPESLGGGD